MGYKIAIDGPSGTGKGYVAHEISRKLGIMYIDTGAMYRAFGLYCYENNVDLNNESMVKTALNNAKIDLVYDKDVLKIFLNDIDVSNRIRTEQVGMFATEVSSLTLVRQHMVEMQRKLAGQNNVVMEGRDIGSVVFPNAELKIFLTADVTVRAERRYNDLSLKNKNITFEEVLADIRKRDENDKNRKVSPLIKMDDMIEIDTTYLNKEQVMEEVLKLVKEKGLIKID